MQTNDNIMTNKTIGGLITFCGWLKEKSYLGANNAEGLKTAVVKVFSTVEPDSYKSVSLDGLDIDDYMDRFRNAAGSSKYKAETIDVYASRIRRAIESFEYYLEHKKPPTSRQRARPKQNGQTSTKKSGAQSKIHKLPTADVFDATLPLSSGQVLVIPDCPKRWPKRDVDLVTGFLRNLQTEEQGQIPAKTGESAAA
ncbi:MAG: hypothetical protein WDZ37_05360 [Solirubrobacterales bacterium]